MTSVAVMSATSVNVMSVSAREMRGRWLMPCRSSLHGRDASAAGLRWLRPARVGNDGEDEGGEVGEEEGEGGGVGVQHLLLVVALLCQRLPLLPQAVRAPLQLLQPLLERRVFGLRLRTRRGRRATVLLLPHALPLRVVDGGGGGAPLASGGGQGGGAVGEGRGGGGGDNGKEGGRGRWGDGGRVGDADR